MTNCFLSRSRLELLAPGRLPIHLDTRYDGGGNSASLLDFPPADSDRLRALYQSVRVLCDQLRVLTRQETMDRAEIQTLLQRPEWAEILSVTKNLGAQNLSEELHSIIHDVRGGSLLGLVGSAHLLEAGAAASNEMLRLFCYARDHLKIMRNCLPDIDPGCTQLDHEAALHPASLYRDKWANARMDISGSIKRVSLHSDFDGNISTRCQEFSAIDRIIYNFFNNAARYGDGTEVQIDIFVPAGAQENNVRFTVQNAVSPLQARQISTLTKGNPSALLQGGLSTSGSGLGLRICTDFITRAFGLSRAASAIAERYIGIELTDQVFVAWFHWPKV